MNYPFIEGISDIQDTQAAYSSRVNTQHSPRSNRLNSFLQASRISQNEDLLLTEDIYSEIIGHHLHASRQEEEPNFHSSRQYVESTLSSMGFKMGYLQQSADNKMILQCLLALIKQNQDTQADKSKIRSQLTQQKFQSNKYYSLLEQAQKTNKQKNKKIGQMENNFEELKNKLKKLEKQSKKERDDDRKNIAMLKSKNQQIMHEVKKKQGEVTRVKQQMRRNIGEKPQPKTLNFQIYDATPQKKNQSSTQAEQRINMLSQRFQNQRKTLVRQNLLLKQKLYDIREEIVNFAEWIDENVFGEANNYSNKFIINHNLLFRKQSIVDQFNEILRDAKSGIEQVISSKAQRKQRNNSQDYSEIQGIQKSENLGLQSPRITQEKVKNKKITSNLKESIKNQNIISPRKTIPEELQKKPTIKSQTPNMFRKPAVNTIIEKKAPKKNYQETDLDNQQAQISLISHISMNDMLEQDKKFDKWDILFDNDV